MSGRELGVDASRPRKDLSLASPRTRNSILKSMAAKMSLRNNAESALKTAGNACVILMHDPLAMSCGNTMFIIPRDQLTMEHRHIFMSASGTNSRLNAVFDEDTIYLRNRAVHLLNSEDKYLDFGDNRWKVERGLFEKYRRPSTENFNMGEIPPCREIYIVVAPV